MWQSRTRTATRFVIGCTYSSNAVEKRIAELEGTDFATKSIITEPMSVSESIAADSTIMVVMWLNLCFELEPLVRATLWILYPMREVVRAVVIKNATNMAAEM